MDNTNNLNGFAKVLADWTQAVTRMQAAVMEIEAPDGLPEALEAALFDLTIATEHFEQLMGVDGELPPEKGRVLFCAAPQLGNVIGRTAGNGDARYDVRLSDGRIISVPADFIGGAVVATDAWLEQRRSPDGKR